MSGSPGPAKNLDTSLWISRPSAPGRTSAEARASASQQSACHSRNSDGAPPTTNVRERSAKHADSRSTGKRSRRTTSSAEIGPDPMSCPIAVCGPWDTIISSATAPCARNVAWIRVFTSSQVRVSPSTEDPRSRAPRDARRSRAIAMPASAASLRAPDPGQLVRALPSGADRRRASGRPRARPRSSECVGDPERERPGHEPARSRDHARSRPPARPHTRAGRAPLGGPRRRRTPRWAEPRGRRRAHRPALASIAPMTTISRSVDLRVDERIGDPERHLVPELGGANGVADDEDRHGRRSYRRAVESTRWTPTCER